MKDATRRAASRSQRTLLPLVAVSGSLAALPSNALELGEMTVQSGLGQPLRASIALALAPNEQVANNCVTLGTGMSASGLPGVGRATVSVADGIIRLTGSSPVREHMVSAKVIVDCPYTMQISREYTLFIDPVNRAAAAPVAAAPPPIVTTAPASAVPARRQESVAPRQASAPTASGPRPAPIGKSTRYQVQPGDSLSRIAERIENRRVGLWSAVNVIFEANPDAFIDNDRDKLMAGSWLEIPSLDGSEPVLAASAPSAVSSVAVEPDVYFADEGESFVVDADAVQGAIDEVDTAEIAAEAVQDLAARPDTIDAGDVVAGAGSDPDPVEETPATDNPFVDYGVTSDDNVVIPDTELAGPTTVSSTANAPTAVITGSTQESGSSWLKWLAGTGVAIFIGLLLFGRFFRRSEELKFAPRTYPSSHRFVKDESSGIEVTEAPASTIDSDAPTEENLSLDADLVVGTGLQPGTDMETATTSGVGIGAQFADSSPTADTLRQPLAADPDDDTILESEVMPEDGDYDLSVIIDATKMPQPEDISQRDLKAVEVDIEDSGETDNYTINREVDFDILAQDYEDEFTATQAVNTEITRAATELARDLEADDTDSWLTTEETVLVPEDETVLMTKEQETAMMEARDDDMAVTAFDVAEQLQLSDDEAADLDDTEITLSETGKMGLLAEDYTLEMAAAENDDDTREMDLEEDTREMEIDEDTVETKIN